MIRLDLSNGKYYEKELVHGTINAIIEQQERKFGITKPQDPANYDVRLTKLIETAYNQTGEKVVILIDEYDAPMLDSINNPELQDYIRSRVRNQIIAKDYAVRFAADTRPVYAVGLNISEDRRTIDSYKIVKVR